MLYKDLKVWLDAMKNHTCNHKDFLPADDPSSDIYSAKIEGREPLKYPTMGYICQGCEEVFEINLKHASIDALAEEEKEAISSYAGRQKLGEYLSGKLAK